MGSRALVIGSSDGSVGRLLGERECAVVQSPSVDDALAGLGDDAEFEAIVLAAGFEALADPAASLRDLTKLLLADGLLVVAAANGLHASRRLQAIVGPLDDTPARDLALLERLFAEAGLGVSERIRVLDPVPAEDLNAALPGLAEVVRGIDADTRSFVLVANRASGGQRGGATILDALQEQLVAAAAAHEAETASLREALEERVELVDRLTAERRHLELEIVVKDDYIAILRGDRNDWRNLHAAVQYELDDLRRSRHYKVAAGMHKAMKRIPFAPTLAKLAARVLARTRG